MLLPACVSLKFLSGSGIDIDDLQAPGAWAVFCFPGDAHPGTDKVGTARSVIANFVVLNSVGTQIPANSRRCVHIKQTKK